MFPVVAYNVFARFKRSAARMIWTKDGVLTIKCPGAITPNWLVIEKPHNKDVVQAAFDYTNLVIAALKRTIAGDVPCLGRKEYEEKEISSHI